MKEPNQLKVESRNVEKTKEKKPRPCMHGDLKEKKHGVSRKVYSK